MLPLCQSSFLKCKTSNVGLVYVNQARGRGLPWLTLVTCSSATITAPKRLVFACVIDSGPTDLLSGLTPMKCVGYLFNELIARLTSHLLLQISGGGVGIRWRHCWRNAGIATAPCKYTKKTMRRVVKNAYSFLPPAT